MRHSIRATEGYLLIDHRNSPGLPSDYMRKLGLNAPSVPEGGAFEAPTLTCCHCGTVVIINPNRIRSRNHCKKCDQYVCDDPACNVGCTPFVKFLDEAQNAAIINGFKGGNHV